jgi:hypothetical protein
MRRILAVFAMLLVAATSAIAQSEPPAPTSAAPTIDGASLGVSLSRIQRRLAADSQARSRGTSPLKLDFYIDVYGTAPAYRFFSGQDLVYGAVPGSAPTHRDMLWHVTPQAFRQPRVDFLSLAAGAAMYGARKAKDWNYERELAAYKKRIESGQIVPAPQPPKR